MGYHGNVFQREAAEELSLLEEKAASVLQVKTLCWPEPENKDGCEKTRARNELVRYPPVSGSKEERCREALGHIAEVRSRLWVLREILEKLRENPVDHIWEIAKKLGRLILFNKSVLCLRTPHVPIV